MKGQAFSVFKILIGAVFAMVLLIVVYMVSTQVECPFTAFETIRDLVLDASKAPGKCFERRNICFKAGTILTKAGFEENLPGIDITIYGAQGIKCDSTKCTVEGDMTIPVKVECSQTTDMCGVYLNQVCT